jgi:hypothetical protein|tara:strand:+ start:100 stop:516 length:417 start_codon:yes stop_codon:yes gene_type:complete
MTSFLAVIKGLAGFKFKKGFCTVSIHLTAFFNPDYLSEPKVRSITSPPHNAAWDKTPGITCSKKSSPKIISHASLKESSDETVAAISDQVSNEIIWESGGNTTTNSLLQLTFEAIRTDAMVTTYVGKKKKYKVDCIEK